MNILPENKKLSVLNAIIEGCSVRSTERLTGVQRDTVLRVCRNTSYNCERLHNRFIKNVRSDGVEFDELWSFVHTKQKRLEAPDLKRGDQYLFVAIDVKSRAVLSYHVGKRDELNSTIFLCDLRDRLKGPVTLYSDAFIPYRDVVKNIFGGNVYYGQMIKEYSGSGKITAVRSQAVYGNPQEISTTRVERNNLTLRMGIKRLQRRTNAHSKTLENHKSAISLFIAYYNFCRVHSSLKITPAMVLGVTDRVWDMKELFSTYP